jgi:hypothetical protein
VTLSSGHPQVCHNHDIPRVASQTLGVSLSLAYGSTSPWERNGQPRVRRHASSIVTPSEGGLSSTTDHRNDYCKKEEGRPSLLNGTGARHA